MPQGPTTSSSEFRFEFERDTFDFANELVCEYVFDPAEARPRMVAKSPRPAYVLRCFVLAGAVRQFFYHARFEPDTPTLTEADYRRRIRTILSRNPRVPSPVDRRVTFPGYEGLRSFSRTWEALLKRTCGGAWRSYVLRSHWRMVFPISRRHQERTRTALLTRLKSGHPPIVHVVRFPQLTINHGLTLFAAEADPAGTRFLAYDPNDPSAPVQLTFDPAKRTFLLPANRYWAGGPLDVIEIYRSWWF